MYYFTNSKSLYPVPELAMILSAIPVFKWYHLYQDRRRGKWDIRVRFPSSDEESNESFLDDETRCDDGYSIFGTRDSLSPRKIFSRFGGSIRFNSKIVFSWLFVISLVMETMGLPSPFFVLWTCWHCYSFPWPVCTNMLIRDRNRYRDWCTLFVKNFENF